MMLFCCVRFPMSILGLGLIFVVRFLSQRILYLNFNHIFTHRPIKYALSANFDLVCNYVLQSLVM